MTFFADLKQGEDDERHEKAKSQLKECTDILQEFSDWDDRHPGGDVPPSQLIQKAKKFLKEVKSELPR